MRLSPPKHLATFCLSLVLILSTIPTRAISPAEASLQTTGRKTITAIATGDFAYISSIVDPQGIYVGYDNVKHPAESFRNDLAQHTGIYCELFEKGCKTNYNPGYTLGHIFTTAPSSNPLNADLQFKIDKDKGILDYIERGGGDLIATLSYRFTGGKWVLYNIHYV